jgi:hypothetical protein
MSSDTKQPGAAKKPLPSGRFLLRLDRGLHALLRAAAAEAGLSLNDYCARRLAAPAPAAEVLGPAAAVVARAASLFGEELQGVVLFGSWARGEAVDASDVDLLVVLADTTALVRALYRRWDEQPIDWQRRDVEVHFAHLPRVQVGIGSLWAEVALDGVVLFERGLIVSRRLAAVRREILAGRMSRRTTQGQPYWVENKRSA